MRFLFWNIKGNSIAPSIAALTREQDVDVLILGEDQIPRAAMLSELNAARTVYFEPQLPAQVPTIATIYARLAPSAWRLVEHPTVSMYGCCRPHCKKSGQFRLFVIDPAGKGRMLGRSMRCKCSGRYSLSRMLRNR
jgi:hypothetical protein